MKNGENLIVFKSRE